LLHAFVGIAFTNPADLAGVQVVLDIASAHRLALECLLKHAAFGVDVRIENLLELHDLVDVPLAGIVALAFRDQLVFEREARSNAARRFVCLTAAPGIEVLRKGVAGAAERDRVSHHLTGHCLSNSGYQQHHCRSACATF
jgi:hypothetical protein